jgi:hypothetical protein
MKQLLESPVEYGDTILAPTTELAGLAELAGLRTQQDRLEAIVRIARQIADEDLAREHVRAQRRAARAGLLVLPRRH